MPDPLMIEADKHSARHRIASSSAQSSLTAGIARFAGRDAENDRPPAGPSWQWTSDAEQCAWLCVEP